MIAAQMKNVYKTLLARQNVLMLVVERYVDVMQSVHQLTMKQYAHVNLALEEIPKMKKQAAKGLSVM